MFEKCCHGYLNEFVLRCPTLVILKKKKILYTQASTSPPPSPHIYHATVWLREHGHKPQKQREMRCLLSSKEV